MANENITARHQTNGTIHYLKQALASLRQLRSLIKRLKNNNMKGNINIDKKCNGRRTAPSLTSSGIWQAPANRDLTSNA